MAASLQEVNSWVERAKEMGATHIISVCDTFDWEDYPVYVMPHETVDEKKNRFDGTNMQKINEIIEVKQ